MNAGKYSIDVLGDANLSTISLDAQYSQKYLFIDTGLQYCYILNASCCLK